jgi:hypothetical protein
LARGKENNYCSAGDMVAELEALARNKGISVEESFLEAAKKYVFVHKFRTVADKMTAKAEDLGIYS